MEVDCFGKCYMVKELDCWVAEINQFDHLGRSAEKKGWFFSTVFSNVPSIACLNGCKVALVAFVWLFSTVRFQMSPQIACPRGCKVALAAFFCLFCGKSHIDNAVAKISIFYILIHGRWWSFWCQFLTERNSSLQNEKNTKSKSVTCRGLQQKWKCANCSVATRQDLQLSCKS